MNYYYFVSSLPSLSIEKKAPISIQDFIVECENNLLASDLIETISLLRDPLTAYGGFADRFRIWEIQLRNIIAEIRSEREKRDSSKYIRPETAPFDALLETEVIAAFSHRSPLDREKALDKLRWEKAESLSGFFPFSPDAIKSYAIKLRIVSRWSGINKENGKRKLEKILEANSFNLDNEYKYTFQKAS